MPLVDPGEYPILRCCIASCSEANVRQSHSYPSSRIQHCGHLRHLWTMGRWLGTNHHSVIEGTAALFWDMVGGSQPGICGCDEGILRNGVSYQGNNMR